MPWCCGERFSIDEMNCCVILLFSLRFICAEPYLSRSRRSFPLFFRPSGAFREEMCLTYAQRGGGFLVKALPCQRHISHIHLALCSELVDSPWFKHCTFVVSFFLEREVGLSGLYHSMISSWLYGRLCESLNII